MKPKKQIDFLVEDFFNTGEVNLNTEEGITFDQLDLLNESIMGEPAIMVNNKISMGDQALRKSEFKDALTYYKKALTLFNDLEDGMKIFLEDNINVDFIKNKIVDSEKKLWQKDYDSVADLIKNKKWEKALIGYENMVSYYDKLSGESQVELKPSKNKIETSGFDVLKGNIRDSEFETKQKISNQTKKQIQKQNQAPLPLLSQDIEIEDDDMFLRTVQNILIHYQNQKINKLRRKEKNREKLINLEKERDESIYGDATEKIVGDYQEQNKLRRTGEVDEITWAHLLSMEKRIERYENRIKKFIDNDKKNIVSPEEYEELITPKENDGSMLKTLLSHNLGNFLYHLQDKDIYAHTSFKSKDYESEFEKLKQYYTPNQYSLTNISYDNINTKWDTKIKQAEEKINELENTHLTKTPKSPTYKNLVDKFGINYKTQLDEFIELGLKKYHRYWIERWIEIGVQKENIEKFEKSKEEDIKKAETFNKKYRGGHIRTQEKHMKNYVKDKTESSRQNSTIVGLFKKLYKAVEEVEFEGEIPLKDINNAIAKINKLLNTEFSEEISENRKNRIKQAIKEVIVSIKDGNIDNKTIEGILELKTLAWGEYEKSFIEDKGKLFDRGERRDIEGRIHNLDGGYLTTSIKSNTPSEIIRDTIKDNISTYVKDYVDPKGNTVKRDIVKHDLEVKNKGIKDREGNIILPPHSKVEVKSQTYTLDSYYSEPLASPMKKTTSEIRSNPQYRQKYNEIIDGLYDWINNSEEGNEYGSELIRKMIGGTAGVLFDDNIYVPIDDIEFYISNKGQNSCNNHRRLTIRYRVKRNVDLTLYKLKEEDGEWILEKKENEVISPTKVELKYCGNENNTPRVIFDPHPLNESLDRYISEALGF